MSLNNCYEIPRSMVIDNLRFVFRFSSSKLNKMFSGGYLILLSGWIRYSYNVSDRGFTKNVFIPRSLWIYFFANQLIDAPNSLFYIMDGLFFQNKNCSDVTLQYNCNNLLTSSRITVSTRVLSSNFSLESISPLFSSTVWLERELSDFSNILYFGLTDTRRLLLDYFEPKGFWQTHISNDKNFNNLIYDTNMIF